MPVLKLPSEVLISIFEQLGSVELRQDVRYLLVCKRLYRAARKAYLKGMSLSRLRLSAYDLERLPPTESLLMRLICAKVQHLSIKLVGHPSRKVSRSLLAEGPERPCYDDDESIDGTDDEVDEKVVVQGKVIRVWEGEHQPALREWKARINQQLVYLAGNLPLCKKLKSFSLEASCEDDPNLGPRWDYLHAETISKVVQRLPTGLCALLLDFCGTDLIVNESNPIHICLQLGERLEDFQCVRLRMRTICPALFQDCHGKGLLERLIIRMNLPMYPDYEGHRQGERYFDARPCNVGDVQGTPIRHSDLMREMALSALAYGRSLSHDMLRIGYRGDGIDLYVLDCLTRQVLYTASGNFCYEEEGVRWDYDDEEREYPYLLPGAGYDWL